MVNSPLYFCAASQCFIESLLPSICIQGNSCFPSPHFGMLRLVNNEVFLYMQVISYTNLPAYKYFKIVPSPSGHSQR